MATQDATLFEDTFTIIDINHEKYDRVSRLTLESDDLATAMTLDINTELYPCNKGEKLHCLLTTSLQMDGSKEEKGWRDVGNVAGGEATLADMYEYVCHGKLYKFEDVADGTTIRAFVSFGGLLMSIEGNYKKLTSLRVDYLYLLIKK